MPWWGAGGGMGGCGRGKRSGLKAEDSTPEPPLTHVPATSTPSRTSFPLPPLTHVPPRPYSTHLNLPRTQLPPVLNPPQAPLVLNPHSYSTHLNPPTSPPAHAQQPETPGSLPDLYNFGTSPPAVTRRVPRPPRFAAGNVQAYPPTGSAAREGTLRRTHWRS